MISVCMPTYNGEKYIKEQIESILSQLSENDELIISDDSSTDNTVKIIKSFNDERIKIYENNHFKSPIYNLENALNYAKGDFIFLSDQDDVWYPEKVSVIIKQLENYDCVVSDATVVDSNMNVLFKSFYKINKSKEGYIHNIIKNGFVGCCMAFNSKILKLSIPFPKNIPMHDSWIGLLSEKVGKVMFLKQSLIFYRRHGGNASTTAEKSNFSLSEKIKMRLILIKEINNRLSNCNR